MLACLRQGKEKQCLLFSSCAHLANLPGEVTICELGGSGLEVEIKQFTGCLEL